MENITGLEEFITVEFLDNLIKMSDDDIEIFKNEMNKANETFNAVQLNTEKTYNEKLNAKCHFSILKISYENIIKLFIILKVIAISLKKKNNNNVFPKLKDKYLEIISFDSEISALATEHNFRLENDYLHVTNIQMETYDFIKTLCEYGANRPRSQ